MRTKPTLNLRHSGVSRIALLTIACTLAMSAPTLAQDTTVATGVDRTTSIFSTTDNSTVINNGSITITGGTTCAIVAPAGANVTVTNNGTITSTSTGTDSGGICTGNNASNINITNAAGGSITTGGANRVASGIDSLGADAIISNAGSITTTGDGAHGISSTGNDATITISGTVSATGDNAFAVKGGAGTQTLSITDAAQITGDIDLGAGNDVVNLSFGAQITGDIDLGAGNDVVNLSFGAQITGAIDLGAGNDVVNISSGTVAGVSRTYTFKNAEKFNIDAAVLAFATRTTTNEIDVVDGDMSVTRLDPTTASATRMALGATTGMIHRQLSQRLAFASAAPQVAKGPTASDTRPGWATVFGGRSRRDEDGLALAFKHRFYGVVGGYDTQMESGQRVGLFGGFGRGKVRTSEVTSITDTATRGFVGVYGQQVIGDLTLNGALVFGRARHKSTRTVVGIGIETASGSYNSTTISPSLSLNWSRALPNGFELRPSAQIAYTYGSYSGYTETGTTGSNMTFGKRKVNIVDSRLQLALAQPFAENRGEIEWRGGITATHYGNDSATARLGSSAFISYDVPGDRTPIGGFVGATLHYAIGDRIRLDSSVEYARTSGSVGALSGQFGLVVKF